MNTRRQRWPDSSSRVSVAVTDAQAASLRFETYRAGSRLKCARMPTAPRLTALPAAALLVELCRSNVIPGCSFESCCTCGCAQSMPHRRCFSNAYPSNGSTSTLIGESPPPNRCLFWPLRRCNVSRRLSGAPLFARCVREGWEGFHHFGFPVGVHNAPPLRKMRAGVGHPKSALGLCACQAQRLVNSVVNHRASLFDFFIGPRGMHAVR